MVTMISKDARHADWESAMPQTFRKCKVIVIKVIVSKVTVIMMMIKFAVGRGGGIS